VRERLREGVRERLREGERDRVFDMVGVREGVRVRLGGCGRLREGE